MNYQYKITSTFKTADKKTKEHLINKKYAAIQIESYIRKRTRLKGV